MTNEITVGAWVTFQHVSHGTLEGEVSRLFQNSKASVRVHVKALAAMRTFHPPVSSLTIVAPAQTTKNQTRAQEDQRDLDCAPATVNDLHLIKVAVPGCPYCADPMRMRYPGNDPECGPARPSCGRSACDSAREAISDAKRYGLTDGTTIEDLHEEALEEERAWGDWHRLHPDDCE